MTDHPAARVVHGLERPHGVMGRLRGLRCRPVVVLVTLTLAGCAHSASSRAARSAAVAGESKSALARSSSSLAQVGATRSPVCTVARLSASTTLTPVGAGSDEYRITITDHGRPCSLRGRPTGLIGVDGSGRRFVLRTRPLPGDDARAMTTEEPAELRAGRTADVVLVTGIACRAGDRNPRAAEKFTSLRLGVAGTWLAVNDKPGPEPYDFGIWLPCTVAMSGFNASFPSTR